jgi:hypothetical protein
VIRRASLGTIVLTVFLELLGFGLVVPYLSGVARAHGASDLVATSCPSRCLLRCAASMLYQPVGHSAPYVAAAVGMAVAGVLSIGLRAPTPAKPGSSEPQTT